MRLSIVRDNRDRGGRSNSRVNASKAIVLEPFVRLTGSRVGFTSRTSPKTDSASTNTCKHLPPLLKRVLFLSSIMGYKGANLPANSPECFFFFYFHIQIFILTYSCSLEEKYSIQFSIDSILEIFIYFVFDQISRNNGYKIYLYFFAKFYVIQR